MHSAKTDSAKSNCDRGRSRSRLPRIGMLAVVLLALTSATASAQLLGGGSPLGGIGGGLGGIGGIGGVGGIGAGSNIGVPGTSVIPQPSTNQIIGPSFSVPIGNGVPSNLPGTGTVTNTVNGTVSNTVNGTVPNAMALPGRTINGVGNTLNQTVRGAPGALAQSRRSGVPPAGERRFIVDEVMVRLPSNLTARATEEIARRHGLTRVESHRIALTGTTFASLAHPGRAQCVGHHPRHRGRDRHRRRAAELSLHADAAARASGERAACPRKPASQQITQYALAKLNVPQAHRFATGDRVPDRGHRFGHRHFSSGDRRLRRRQLRRARLEGARAPARHRHGGRHRGACQADRSCTGGPHSGDPRIRREKRKVRKARRSPCCARSIGRSRTARESST